MSLTCFGPAQNNVSCNWMPRNQKERGRTGDQNSRKRVENSKKRNKTHEKRNKTQEKGTKIKKKEQNSRKKGTKLKKKVQNWQGGAARGFQPERRNKTFSGIRNRAKASIY